MLRSVSIDGKVHRSVIRQDELYSGIFTIILHLCIIIYTILNLYKEMERWKLVKTTILQRLAIIVKSVYVTLRITFAVLFMEYRETYDREYGDDLLRWWSSRLLKAVNATYEVLNPYNVIFKPKTPYIIMSNHSSHYDIPLVFMALPGSIRMLTKKELFKVPIWGRGMKAGEFISIDRHNITQAIEDLKKARAKMEDGVVLWIAPEGTRSRTGRLGSFKKGGFVLAIETGATIIPVGIVGSEKILPPGTWDFNLNQHVRVNIGEPIDASKYTLENKDSLINDVREQIAALSGEWTGSWANSL